MNAHYMTIYSLPLTLITIFFYFLVATLTFRLEKLKSHRIDQLLKQLGSAFFFLSLLSFLKKGEPGNPKRKLLALLKATTLLLQVGSLLFYIEYSQHRDLAFLQAVSSTQASLPLASYHWILFWVMKVAVSLLILLFPLMLSRISQPLFYRAIAPLVSIISTLLLPLSFLFAYSTDVGEAQESTEEEKNESAEVKEGLLALIHDAESKARLTDLNRRLLDGIFNLQERVAREIMVPRVEVFALEKNTSIAEATAHIIAEGKTRVPVYNENIDQVEGILFAKDLLSLYAMQSKQIDFEKVSIQEHCKKAMFIPSTKRVSDLLQDFRKKKTHLAIIVDEYGGTEGLITIEDILEELVGDISDEYDVEDAPITQLSERQYIVDAHMSLLDLNEQLGVSIPLSSEYDSLSGFIFHKLGSIPAVKQVICQGPLDLEVVECSARSVERVRVTVRDGSCDNKDDYI